MNGEVYQLCSLVVAAKVALRDKTEIKYIPLKYEKTFEFRFLEGQTIVQSVKEWFNTCIRHGMVDIKCLMPLEVKDRGILGFSNTNQSSIVCFYKDESVRYFVAKWSFDADKKGWNIVYEEYNWADHPKGKPVFYNNSTQFTKILEEIKEFAILIGFGEGFGKKFQKASNILNGKYDYSKDEHRLPMLNLPVPFLNIFMAASEADVFGAMGSWNDSPPWYAHEKGLDKEYNTLSAELLKQMRLAILYAVNEF